MEAADEPRDSLEALTSRVKALLQVLQGQGLSLEEYGFLQDQLQDLCLARAVAARAASVVESKVRPPPSIVVWASVRTAVPAVPAFAAKLGAEVCHDPCSAAPPTLAGDATTEERAEAVWERATSSATSAAGSPQVGLAADSEALPALVCIQMATSATQLGRASPPLELRGHAPERSTPEASTRPRFLHTLPCMRPLLPRCKPVHPRLPVMPQKAPVQTFGWRALGCKPNPGKTGRLLRPRSRGGAPGASPSPCEFDGAVCSVSMEVPVPAPARKLKEVRAASRGDVGA